MTRKRLDMYKALTKRLKELIRHERSEAATIGFKPEQWGAVSSGMSEEVVNFIDMLLDEEVLDDDARVDDVPVVETHRPLGEYKGYAGHFD